MKVGSLVEYVGGKSVCPQSTKEYLRLHGYVHAKRGETYTVRGFLETSDGLGIYLEEIVNPKVMSSDMGYIEFPFGMNHFRELQPPIPNVEQWVNDNTLELVEVNPKQ